MMSISETSSAQSASATASRNTSDRGPTSLSGTRSWIRPKVNVVAIKLATRIMKAEQKNQNTLKNIMKHDDDNAE
jgi:hypothetical protein